MSSKEKFKLSKVKSITIAIILTLIFTIVTIWLTVDLIKETGDWSTFNIDFTSQGEAISAYASLLSGVLLFLTILFIVLQLVDQRRKEKLDKEDEQFKKNQRLQNRLAITSTFIEQIIKDILNQGGNLTEYYIKETTNPTLMSQCYFVLNKHSEALLNLNTEITYQAFQEFQPTEDWKKAYLNLSKQMHFYSEVFPHLQQNYHGHIQDKVTLKGQIQQSIHDFLSQLSNVQNNLVAEFNASGNLEIKLLLDFFKDFLDKYNDQCTFDKKAGDSNLTLYSTKHYQPFREGALQLIQRNNQFTPIVSPLLQQMSRIIIDVERLEAMAINFSADLKKQIDKYFVMSPDFLGKLEEIKNGIDIAKIKT